MYQKILKCGVENLWKFIIKSHFYFIPEFEPTIALNVSQMLPESDLRLCGSAKEKNAISGKNGKLKNPPRPPNAFILYRHIGILHEEPVELAQRNILNMGITCDGLKKETSSPAREEGNLHPVLPQFTIAQSPSTCFFLVGDIESGYKIHISESSTLKVQRQYHLPIHSVS
ncbi:18531_t:CDS:2 [Acaulospora morrowiae]|uniref:18531_t:CDS:1 n=1 Tax=Acaulospora morrowiae TaxID=94023 RepID=A0A9N9GI91_9GLOM|nr:18531_t:CDS:2 [Acaulospora morrowiae]